MQELVGLHLRNAGFEPVNAVNGPEAIRAAREESPRLIVLDLMLPGLSGLEVCRLLKADALTREHPAHHAHGQGGGDRPHPRPGDGRGRLHDETVQPARTGAAGQIRPAPRGRRAQEPDQLKAGLIVVDRDAARRARGAAAGGADGHRVQAHQPAHRAAGQVQSRDSLLSEVWGYESAIDTRTVDTHVRRLRDKLGEEAAECIETIRGFGYRVAAEE